MRKEKGCGGMEPGKSTTSAASRIIPCRPLFALGFPGGTSGKEPACHCWRHKRHGFDPWVRKIPWRRECYPLQYSCLENSMDREAWWVTVHGVAKELDYVDILQ